MGDLGDLLCLGLCVGCCSYLCCKASEEVRGSSTDQRRQRQPQVIVYQQPAPIHLNHPQHFPGQPVHYGPMPQHHYPNHGHTTQGYPNHGHMTQGYPNQGHGTYPQPSPYNNQNPPPYFPQQHQNPSASKY